MFHNCFAVGSISEDKPFFEQGDSGSGVLVMDEDKTYKPLGIAFAYLPELVAVCQIDEILDKLNLQIVRYLENTREVTEDTHELTEETQELIEKKRQELTEKTQESTEKTQKPTETQELPNKTEESASCTQSLNEDTKDLTKNTQELKIQK